MGYVEDLNSGLSPKIRSAAQKIVNKKLSGHGEDLVKALVGEVEKPKAWQSQCKLVRALGVTGYTNSLPYLKELTQREFQATLVYRELAFSIALLDGLSADHLDFLYETFDSQEVMPITGVCAALLYREIVPPVGDIERILSYMPLYTRDEGRVMTPRVFIAAASYSWPAEQVKEFLQACMQSDSATLVEIASDILAGKKPEVRLI